MQYYGKKNYFNIEFFKQKLNTKLMHWKTCSLLDKNKIDFIFTLPYLSYVFLRGVLRFSPTQFDLLYFLFKLGVVLGHLLELGLVGLLLRVERADAELRVVELVLQIISVHCLFIAHVREIDFPKYGPLIKLQELMYISYHDSGSGRLYRVLYDDIGFII